MPFPVKYQPQTNGAHQIGSVLNVDGWVPLTQIRRGLKFHLHYGDLGIKTVIRNAQVDGSGVVALAIHPPIAADVVIADDDLLEIV